MSHFEDKKTNICIKNNIILQKNKSDGTYYLNFSILNPRINLKAIINFNLYTFLAKINSECIENVELVSKLSDTSACFLFLFKSIGKDFGIPKKYMYVKTDVFEENDTLTFTSNSINPCDEIKKKISGYELLTCNNSLLFVSLSNTHHANINYNFNIDIHEDLPIYMQNLPGLMMKKIFYHLKLFIEKI